MHVHSLARGSATVTSTKRRSAEKRPRLKILQSYIELNYTH